MIILEVHYQFNIKLQKKETVKRKPNERNSGEHFPEKYIVSG